MKCADCDTEISQSNPKLCPYCGSRNLVKDSKEETEHLSKNEIILLESKLAILFKDRFVYKGETYPISSMKNASLDEDSLVIKFENGQFKRFMVGSISTDSMLNAYFSNFTIDTGIQEIKAVTQQFVTTINMLITMR